MPKRLEQEVWALDKCCGCGDCVSLCAKGVLFWGTDESPAVERREKALGLSHTTLDTCTFCQQLCEEGCPRLDDKNEVFSPRNTVSVRTKGIVQSGEPAETLKNLLIAALSAGLIDGAILTDIDPWSLKPVVKVASSVREVVDTLAVPVLWAPPLTALNEAIFERHLKHLAVVGTPCVSQAVRKLVSSRNERLRPYQEAIRLNIATFCTGIYRPELVGEFLVGKLGVAQPRVKRVETSPRRGDLTVHLWDSSRVVVPLKDVEGYTRKGCARCDDYLGESADLAVGAVGAKDGYCTLITRNQTGEAFLSNALGFGLLESCNEVDTAALAQARTEKERRQRAQAFDRLTVMMLDALAEPGKRAAVKQAFVRLFEVREPDEQSTEEASCVTCAQC